jgi:type VI secretion system protein ImpH
MASSCWGTDRSLTDHLFSDGCEFDFFQAVRLLSRMYKDRQPVGEAARPEAEIVRFRSTASLRFPASAICGIRSERERQPAMTVAFLGLTGPKAALPVHFSERVAELARHGDRALQDFLAVFDHRWISLFYRAWEKHRIVAGYERVQTGGPLDAFTSDLLHVIGMGAASLRGRLPVPDLALLPYAGLIAQQPHSASALGGVLRHYFGIPAEVVQFRGKWHRLEVAERCYPRGKGVHNQLGAGATLGHRIWSAQAVFRVSLGPLTYPQFLDFLPDGEGHRKAAAWISLFASKVMTFELQPVLKKAEVPRCVIAKPRPGGARLGWSAWLKTREFTRDATQAVFAARHGEAA